MSDSARVNRVADEGREAGPGAEAGASPGAARSAEAGAVPVLQDLTSLLGLVPTIVTPNDSPGAYDDARAPAPARPRGRRPASEEQRTTPFSVRLTAEERALVYRAAMFRSPETSVAAWARAALVALAREVAAAEGIEA